jgi:hypothetical protein
VVIVVAVIVVGHNNKNNRDTVFRTNKMTMKMKTITTQLKEDGSARTESTHSQSLPLADRHTD